MIYDVAIVGCGPVGALAGNLLGKAGLSVIILEREHDLHPMPRATHLDHEAMRLLQAAGLADAASSLMHETDGHLHIGADGGVIRYMSTFGQPKPFGWASDYFFFQPELEACLRSGLAAHANVHVQLGVEVSGLSQDSELVALHCNDGLRQARYVIGCDGARSAIRKSLGIKLLDLDFEETWLVVDAEVDGDVTFPPIAGLPQGIDLQRLSTTICDPRRPTTVVPGPRNRRRWEFMLLPGETESQMVDPVQVNALIEPWLQNVTYRVLRATTYDFHGLVAELWNVGRVFLAGDAAHQTPPFFGQGMCHGMRDVANLGWKLEAVIAGHADERLLGTYQQEREPHVRKITAAAIEAGRYICESDPGRASERDASMRERMRQTPQVAFGDLIPKLEQGFLLPSSPGAGERFIQPRMDGKLLDALTGTGWRLFVDSKEGAQSARSQIQQMSPEMNVSVIDVSALPDHPAFSAWLDARHASCALVRPDFYVFGCAAQPSTLVAGLARALNTPSRSKRPVLGAIH